MRTYWARKCVCCIGMRHSIFTPSVISGHVSFWLDLLDIIVYTLWIHPYIGITLMSEVNDGKVNYLFWLYFLAMVNSLGTFKYVFLLWRFMRTFCDYHDNNKEENLACFLYSGLLLLKGECPCLIQVAQLNRAHCALYLYWIGVQSGAIVRSEPDAFVRKAWGAPLSCLG